MKGAIAIAIFTLFLKSYNSMAQLDPDTCGPIGSNDEREGDDEEIRAFYLNAADPARCSGYVTSWRVCYYEPDDNDSLDDDEQRNYWATYAVYRKMGFGRNQRYERVSDIFKAVRAATGQSSRIYDFDAAVVDGRIQQEVDFVCYSDTVDNSPLFVQTGDIIGACVFRPEDRSVRFTRRQLDVVGESDWGSLLQMSITSGGNGCTIDTIPSTVLINDLSNRNYKRLHIYANIGAENPAIMEIDVSTSPDAEAPTSSPTTTTTTRSDTSTTLSPNTASVLTTTTDIPSGLRSTTKSQVLVQTESTKIQSESSAPSTNIQLVTTDQAITQSDASTSSQETTANFETEKETENSFSSLSSQATVGLSIGLLLSVMSLGVATVVAVICLMWYRRANSDTSSAATQDGGISLDNQMYDTGLNNEADASEVSVRKDQSTRSIYAASSIYDYATRGPNEELQNPVRVLPIPAEAHNTHNLTGVLSSPFETAESMYRDLATREICRV